MNPDSRIFLFMIDLFFSFKRVGFDGFIMRLNASLETLEGHRFTVLSFISNFGFAWFLDS